MKYYLLPAAIEDLCEKIFTVYEAHLDDLSVTRELYVDHFRDMAHHLFIAKSYTRFSDVLKDIESGRWNVAGLDQNDEEDILVWLEEITERASELLDEARDEAMLGESDDYDIVIIERINQ